MQYRSKIPLHACCQLSMILPNRLSTSSNPSLGIGEHVNLCVTFHDNFWHSFDCNGLLITHEIGGIAGVELTQYMTPLFAVAYPHQIQQGSYRIPGDD